MSVWAGLIERLEACQGPDRGLDAEIHAHIHGGYVEAACRPSNRATIWNKDNGYYKEAFSGFMTRDRKMVGYADDAPRYTSSLDAALTLVPEKMWWEVGRVQEPTSPMRHFGSARVHMATVSHYGEKPYNGHHDKAALALCIDALKARVSHGVDEPG